jgi:hypothetical protein
MESGRCQAVPPALSSERHLDMLADIIVGRPAPYSKDRFRELRDHDAAR